MEELLVGGGVVLALGDPFFPLAHRILKGLSRFLVKDKCLTGAKGTLLLQLVGGGGHSAAQQAAVVPGGNPMANLQPGVFQDFRGHCGGQLVGYDDAFPQGPNLSQHLHQVFGGGYLRIHGAPHRIVGVGADKVVGLLIEDDVLELPPPGFLRLQGAATGAPELQHLPDESGNQQRHKVGGTLSQGLQLDDNRANQPLLGFHAGAAHVVDIANLPAQKAADTHLHDRADVGLGLSLVARLLHSHL